MFTNTPDEHFIIDLELGPRAPLVNAPRALTNSSSWSSLARTDAFGKLASEAGRRTTRAAWDLPHHQRQGPLGFPDPQSE